MKKYMRDPVKTYFGLLKIQAKFYINLKLEFYLIVSIPDLCTFTYFNATSLST